MSRKIYTYLQSHFPQKPKAVDKLIISAYFRKNNLKVTHNIFLKEYIIKPSEKKESQRVDEFIQLIDQHFKRFNLETLIELFEFVISPADRKVTGAVYTPTYIREYIVKNILYKRKEIGSDWTVVDIACGCGGFLYTMAKHLKKITGLSYLKIFQHNIYGLDIKDYATTRTKLLLSTLAVVSGEDIPTFNFNLFVGDALNFNWSAEIKNFSYFDCCVGNPPYVCSRKIDEKTKLQLLKFEVCSSGHPDLYIPFFQIGMELLKANGVLSFITMNSFFKSLNGRSLRKYFQTNKWAFQIVDFGTLQVFRNRSTYTCICTIQKTIGESIAYCRVGKMDDLNSSKQKFNTINYSSLKFHNGWNLLAAEVINKIESIGISFSKKFKTRNGIATLKNEVYIFKPVKEDKEFYWLENVNLFPIEKQICKDIVNPNLLTTQSSLGSIKEKLIFPYEFVNGKAQIMSEKSLKNAFPFAHKYLTSKKQVLSTRDKGEGEYVKWFAFGRTQSLEQMKFKLFFPHITPHSPHFIIDKDENLFFYNGIAVIGQNERELLFLKKLMSSRLFWFYLRSTSKPYSSGYLSMSKNYIKDFGVYNFSEEEIEYIVSEPDFEKLNLFFEKKYDIILPEMTIK